MVVVRGAGATHDRCVWATWSRRPPRRTPTGC